jgi:hypothetical protein
MSNELEQSEKNFILTILGGYLSPVPRNLAPMFYHSLSYEGDCALHDLAVEIESKIGPASYDNES